MKNFKILLASTLVVLVSASCAFAKDCANKTTDNLEAYAHPTMFGSQAQTLVNAESDAIIGGKVYKPCHAKTMEGKENVILTYIYITVYLNIVE